MLKKLLKSEIKLNSRQKTALYITLVYAVITFLLCLKHEMWSDELNVWMAIKHYSFPELIKFSSEAGNPIFFFLPLFPFIKLGFSAHFIQIFCWLCSVSAVFLLNFLAPFGTVTKILITFGAPMLYHYSVMARCYSVLPPLMFLTAVLYPYICLQESAESCKTDRDSILLKNTAVILYACCIAAIACTHIITFVFVAGLTALFVYKNIIKNKKRSRYEWAAAAIMTAGIIIVTAQTLYALSVNTVFDHIPITADGIKYALTDFFTSMTDGLNTRLFRYYKANSLTTNCFPAVMATAFCIETFFLYKINRFYAIITLGTFLFYLYISITSYGAVYPYRSYTLLITIISLLWTEKNRIETNVTVQDKKKKFSAIKAAEYLTAFMMFLTFPTGIETAAEDWKKNFSSGFETADFIKKNIPASDKNVIISTMLPIAFYLNDRPVYYEYEKRLLTIMIKKNADINLTDFANRYDNIYVVLSGLQKDLIKGQTLLYESPEAMSPAERFYVYKFSIPDYIAETAN